MALPLYLAMTSAEMAGNPLPPRLGCMVCHFSPGGNGLSGLPEELPPGAMLVLDDCTPMDGHDPQRILKQLSSALEHCQCESLLLDFQRPGIPGQRELANILTSSLPCPVGVSELYAEGLSCPVFLPPVPPDKLLAEYVAPWKGREIWLEAALDGIALKLTESGCTVSPLPDFPEAGLPDKKLHCHYTSETTSDSATFRLWRTPEDLNVLLKEAENHGATRAVGLWQELYTG